MKTTSTETMKTSTRIVVQWVSSEVIRITFYVSTKDDEVFAIHRWDMEHEIARQMIRALEAEIALRRAIE